ncbi:MAG: tetratricopeptide repeat protein [Thermoanaerobaculia bacterium]
MTSTCNSPEGLISPRLISRRARAVVIIAVLPFLSGWDTAAGCPRLPEATGFQGRGPVLPLDVRDLDPAVRDLIERLASEVRADPSNAKVHGELGLAYAANHLWSEAKRSFTVAGELDSDSYDWRFYRAVALQNLGKLQAAYLSFAELASQYPHSPPLLHRLADSLLESGRTEDAAQIFRDLIEVESELSPGYVGLAECQLRMGQPRDAVLTLNKALTKDPNYHPAHYLLGTALRHLGRSEEAAEHLERGVGGSIEYIPDRYASALEKYSVNLPSRLGQAATLLSAGDYLGASSLLEETLRFHPDNVTLLNDLAVVYLRADQLDLASSRLEQARERDPSHFGTYLNLASLAMRGHRYEDALEYSNTATQFAPHLVHPVLSRVSALMALGNSIAAQEALETALELNPDHPLLVALARRVAGLAPHE